MAMQTKPHMDLNFQLVTSGSEPGFVKIEAASLFAVVQDVLSHAIVAAEKCFQLQKQGLVHRTGSNRVPTYTSPLGLLKEIACKVGCKEKTDEEAYNSVLEMLSKYSWGEKTVLTLAAFAMIYGVLMFYVDSRQLGEFASSISSLMRVDFLIGNRQDRNFQQAFDDLNQITNILMEMIEHILEFEQLSTLEYDKRNTSAVKLVQQTRDKVTEHSQHVIRDVIYCTQKVNYLNGGRDTAPELPRGISNLPKQLEELKEWHKKIDDLKAYMKIVSFFQKREGITELIKRLMHCSEGGQCLYDCQSKLQVDIEFLKGKNVLLFISTLDVSDYDLEAVLDVHEELIRKHHDYKIVWIPIVEVEQVWDLVMGMKMTEMLEKMKWYAVCYQKPIIGIRYIKKEWHFSNNPMVAVLNSQGVKVCDDAMHMIRLWRKDAFPFNPHQEMTAIESTLITLFLLHYVKIREEVDKGSYIVIYGGKDQWINDFRGQVLGKLKDCAGKEKISVASFTFIQDNIQGPHDHYGIKTQMFWTIIESFYYLKMQWTQMDDAAIAIQKLLSYRKDQEGWALLYHKGSSSMICASGAVIVEAVELLVKPWNKPTPPPPFAERLPTIIEEIQPPPACCHIEIPNSSGWVPLK